MHAILDWFAAVIDIPLFCWLQQVYLGLVNGSVFVLLALGLSIIFGLMRIMNFAHGAYYMLGAYMGWVFINLTGSFWVALLIIPFFGALIGVLTEVFLLRHTYNKKESEYLGILVTFGIFMAVPDLMRWIFGNMGLPYPQVLSHPLFTFGCVPFSAYRGFLIIVAAALCFLMWLLLQKTDLGMIIRAGSSNFQMVEVLGINIRKVWTVTFAIGIALASLAGILVGPILAVQPTMGAEILIQCFIVVIIGGLGSFWGAVLAGFLVGQILTIFPLLPYCTTVCDVVLFAVAAIVLVTRPRGLFGLELEP